MILCIFARLVLPPKCRIGVVGRPKSTAVKTRGMQSSASNAVIPRLIRLPASPSISSPGNSSNSSTSPSLLNLLKRHSSLSASAVSVSSPSGGSSIVPDRGSNLLFTRSILKQNSSPKLASVSSSYSTTTSIHSSSTSTFTQNILTRQEQPFRTQMILFQPKQDSDKSGSDQTRLLEISSNCAWERIRPQVLARLSYLTKNADGYPQTCVMSIDGFRLEVQPRSKFPTEIPPRLRASLGMSSMFAIRARITAERNLSSTTGSVSLPVDASAAKSSAQRLRVCNGLNVGSVHNLSVDSSKQASTTDVPGHNSFSTHARHSTRGKTSLDSSRPTTAPTYINKQKTDTVMSQQVPTGLLENTDLLNKDSSSVIKLACPVDGTDSFPQKWPEALFDVETVRTAAQDATDHCGEDSRLDVDSRINTCGNMYINNSDNCAALQQQLEDTAAINSDRSSVSGECTEVANNCLYTDDRNFLPSDNVNFPSSSAQTLSGANCTELTCSLQADDGNFPSSAGLTVPTACPLDLRT